MADPSLSRRIFQHTFCEGAMRLFLELVLDAACSLRGASAVMRLLGRLRPELQRAPVANTGQMWLLRLGLFELSRPKEAAEDWVWIVDHTVQIGVQKCLLIAGVRLSAWRAQQRPLEHRDLHMLTLEPVEKSDGPLVFRQLEETRRRTGLVPRAILSDEGTDLKGGVEAFRAAHPTTIRTLDIAHQAAKHLKRELESDDRWKAFCAAAGGAKQRLAQTPLACLLPPTPRAKARYMNLDELVAWGQHTLGYLDEPHPLAGLPVDSAALQSKLGWLADYRAALEEWRQTMATISATLSYIRHEGYHRGAARALRPLLVTCARSAMSRRIAARLIHFVRQQSAAACQAEQLIGSSECLESLIGKGKRLEGQQSKSGFTKMVLAMAAAVAKPTKDYIPRALAAVTTADVLAWCRARLGVSVQSQRRQAFAGIGTEMG